MRDMLVKGLSTLPAKALTDLRNALSEQHNVKLDNARQIAEMEERKRQGIAPKGFKIPTFHMPAPPAKGGSAPLDPPPCGA